MKRLAMVLVLSLTTLFYPVSNVAFAGGGAAGTAEEERDYEAKEAASPSVAAFSGGFVELWIGAACVAAVVLILIIILAPSGGGSSSPSSTGTEKTKCWVCNGIGFKTGANSGKVERCIYCNGEGVK